MKKLSLFLSRKTLLAICKSFVSLNLDYTDIIYDKPFNESFKTKMEMIQYRAALYQELRIYQELESLADKRCSRKSFSVHKIVNGLFPSYL